MKMVGARTTLGDLNRATPLVRVNCEKCQHHAPLACAVAVIRWGAGGRRLEFAGNVAPSRPPATLSR
jgi:hypothetical protein